MKKKAKNHMREWSERDVKRMRTYARRRVSARVTADKLGRSAGALRYKAMMLGISFRSIGRKVRR